MRTEWRLEQGEYKPVVIADDGTETPVTWAPQRGSQEVFLSCPITEVLYTGTRGPGKTDALLMDFAQEVGKGYSADWNGIIFRRTFPELKDIINKSRKWFPRIWPRAKYNASQHIWTWPTGEMLSFRQFNKPSDYWKYHGHCLDEGEVLTSCGWVPIQNVTTQMRVVSATTDGEIVERSVVSTTKEWFDGELVRYSGRGRYMSFTPEHKIAVAAGSAGHKLIPYSQAGRNISLRTGGWSMPSAVSGIEVPAFFSAGTTTQDYCAFMGWYLAEGWTLKNGARKSATYKCGIAQSKVANPEKYAAIESLLNRVMPVNVCTSKDGFVWSHKECASYLRQFGGSLKKFIPRQIIEQSNTEDIRAFLEAYIDGDGTRQGDRLYGHTISKVLADGLCEIAPRLGYSVHMTQRMRPNREHMSYTVAFNPRPTLNLRSDNRQRAPRLGVPSSKVQSVRVPHHGYVYCIGVEDTHSFFVRQRGSVWLSGNSYPFIGWEELTTWPTDECLKSMFSCSRSTIPGMPRKVRATTNPYGVGHNFCKLRYRLPVKPGEIIGEIITDSRDESGELEPTRVAIHGYLDENKILMLADPGYKQRLRAAARNPSELKAWLEGSWDIVAGGMIDDVWDAKIHVIEPFRIPDSWIIERAFDWGSTKPFSLAWWAESDGTALPDGRVFYRGTKIRIAEWYGWNKKPNEGLKMLAVEIARQGLEMERHMKYRVQAGPADPSIFAAENGVCIADDMARMGMGFKPADAGPGSRKNGAERVRKYLKASMKHPMEEPGLFVFNTCSQFIRTVPVIPRDDKDPEDVATESEDHIWDETRYEIMFKRPSVSMPKLVGV